MDMSYIAIIVSIIIVLVIYKVKYSIPQDLQLARDKAEKSMQMAKTTTLNALTISQKRVSGQSDDKIKIAIVQEAKKLVEFVYHLESSRKSVLNGVYITQFVISNPMDNFKQFEKLPSGLMDPIFEAYETVKTATIDVLNQIMKEKEYSEIK